MNPIQECRLCGTQFEEGVADPGPDGQVRCPQCLLFDAVPVESGREKDWVVTAATPFH